MSVLFSSREMMSTRVMGAFRLIETSRDIAAVLKIEEGSMIVV